MDGIEQKESLSENVQCCSEGYNRSECEPDSVEERIENSSSRSAAVPMNESINDETIQMGYMRYSEESDQHSIQSNVENRINSAHQGTSGEVGANMDEADVVNVNEYELFSDHEIGESTKKGCVKRPVFKRIRIFYRFLRGKRKKNDIDKKFRTTLNDEELKEYNNEPCAVLDDEKGNDKLPLQTVPALNAHPHYIHHILPAEERLKYLLARRSCHLPGNNWYQDWVQFICNNHPLFGLCLRHELHPLSLKDRLFILLASLSYGVIATNLIYLYFLTTDKDFERDLLRLNFQIQEGLIFEVVLTSGITTLLIFNGALHVGFDISLWHLSAATCCHHLKNHRIIKKYGSYTVLAIALLMFVFASLVLLLRVSYIINEDEENDWEDILEIETFFILMGYVLQLSLVYFILSPILVTTLFSGCLGFIPGLGGRPSHIQREMNFMIQQEQARYNSAGESSESSQDSENEYCIV